MRETTDTRTTDTLPWLLLCRGNALAGGEWAIVERWSDSIREMLAGLGFRLVHSVSDRHYASAFARRRGARSIWRESR